MSSKRAEAFKIMDDELASRDFCDRLCLVRTASSSDGGDNPAARRVAPAGREVSSHRLWPALKFSSQKDLMDQIMRITRHEDASARKRMCAVSALEFGRARRLVSPVPTANEARDLGVAYLLGSRDDPSSGRLVLLPKSDDEVGIDDGGRVCEFMWHILEMEDARGEHCGSEEFQRAFKLAMRRMEDFVDGPPGGSPPRPSPRAARVKEERVATMTTVGSGRKAFSNAEYSPAREKRGATDTTVNSGNKTYDHLEHSPMNKKRSGERKKEDEALPVRTVVLRPRTGGSVSSPEKPSFSQDEGEDERSETTNSVRSKGASSTGPARRRPHRCSSAPKNEIPWITMWDKMKRDGWTTFKGHGLSAFMYVHPTWKNVRKAELLQDGNEGSDYFNTQEDVMKYARMELGWKSLDPVKSPGDGSQDAIKSPGDGSKDADSAGRVKKRKRGSSKKQPFGALVKSVREETKAKRREEAQRAKEEAQRAKEEAKEQMKARKTKNPAKTGPKKKAPPPQESQQNSSDDESSRFSEAPSPKKKSKKAKKDVFDFREEGEESGEESGEDSGKESGSDWPDEGSIQSMASDESADSSSEESGEDPKGNDESGDAADSGSHSSDSPSEQSSIDATYRVMPGTAAWRLLIDRFGFSHHPTGKYCLPGKENRPGKGSTAVEGTNHFSSLNELRKHLCAYGLPEVKKYLDEDEVTDLQRWVRYAHVSGLCDGALVDPNDLGEPINFAQAWRWMKSLGMKYTGRGYRVTPKIGPFESQGDFMVHLARFGYPCIDGIRHEEVLEEDQKLILDLYIADTEVDTFKRIDPNSGNSNEVTPRRARRRQKSQATQSVLTKLSELQDVARPPAAQQKQALNRQRFQMEFSNLKHQRTLPKQLLGSNEALSMLVDNYNFGVLERDGADYYCLPGIDLAEEAEDGSFIMGRDYFESVQHMRENLCAYGLPPTAKGSKLGKIDAKKLECWIRCANIDALGDEARTVPSFVEVTPKIARTILKGLNYKITSNYDTFVLPGVSMHKSTLGKNRFEKIIDLVNHIARFGLDSDKTRRTPDLEKSVTDEDKTNLEIFVASVATFDVCKRIQCDAPIEKKSRAIKQENTTMNAPPVAHAGLNTKHENGVQNKAVTESDNVARTPCQPPAVVVDDGDQDTPEPSPPKRTNTIKDFFSNAAKKVGEVVATLSPAKRSSSSTSDSLAPLADDQRDESSPVLSSLNGFSPSCLVTKGDDEVEACFAGTPERDDQALVAATPRENATEKMFENDFATRLNQASTGQQKDIPQQEGSSTMEQYPQAESHYIEWNQFWSKNMRKAGWDYCKGNDLVAWYWVHPYAVNMKKSDMLRECTEGEHYFTTEEDIHRYAMAHLGWSGNGKNLRNGKSMLNSSPASDMSMTSRVKTRSRTNNATLESDDASSLHKRPIASVSNSDEVVTTPKKFGPAPLKKMRSSPGIDDNVGEAAEKPRRKRHSSKPGNGDSINSSNSIDSEQNEYMAPPDNQPTIRDKLECCQMVLHPTFKKNELSKSSSMSVVSSMEHGIRDFMTKSIQTGTTVDGMTLQSPGFMYICGGPGTGKTTAVTSCAGEMKKWARGNGYDKPCFCFMNMASSQTGLNCKGGIMRVMLKKIASAIKIDEAAGLTAFEKQFKKKVLVLVLDEIDMLFKQHGGIGETWFRTLVEWSEDKEMRFSMIGISNCVNDVNASRVRELGHSPRELIFSAYKEEDILAILEQRLGKNVVDHKALQLISRRVAASSGDARRALELTANAVGKCADILTDEKLDMEVKHDDIECMPLVKLPHMMRAIREGMPMRHADVISGLPQAAKVILCIAVSLSQVWGPTAEISISILKKYCVEATHHAVMDELGVGRIMGLVEMLTDSGLLITDCVGGFSSHDANAKLKIGVQLDDVEIALEESLLDEGSFYQSLVDYIKRECPNASSP